MYEWNEAKRVANFQTHGVDFLAIESFEWSSAVILEDARKDYGEPCFRAFGPINGKMHCIAFTVRG